DGIRVFHVTGVQTCALPISLIETSRLVASSRSRLAKIAALAAFLQTLAAEEIKIAVDWLTGNLPQGKIGLGHRSLAAAADAPARTGEHRVGDDWRVSQSRER